MGILVSALVWLLGLIKTRDFLLFVGEKTLQVDADEQSAI
jgi:hypothetical protein